MANPEHLAILKEGVQAWNKWRAENAEDRPDLRGADLSGADLSEADLREVDLSEARLIEAILCFANLSGANLYLANLSEAILCFANLRGARLSGADLSEADLSEADLRGARLSGANLNRANLRGANLTGADLGEASHVEEERSEALPGRETAVTGGDSHQDEPRTHRSSMLRSVPLFPSAAFRQTAAVSAEWNAPSLDKSRSDNPGKEDPAPVSEIAWTVPGSAACQARFLPPVVKLQTSQASGPWRARIISLTR